jgi:hypothetical protein
MLQANAFLTDALAEKLMLVFARSFGASAPGHAALIGEAARLIIERLSLSDALYHDAEHTALVTLVAQDILRGRVTGISDLGGLSVVANVSYATAEMRPTAPSTTDAASGKR